ncbi:hypothetical protein KL928_004530 [Ogataea angusta]|uniref:Uncharacterized protein n=1 Tax=Pichia angusta TaxID=870730 RepID=A0AAN6DCR1_PICAN|nr:uncharacterized protein KL928_004530 [Ogataea angusta]KAG7816488.1 hypothetical protein KL928_004530 [Ogataea angusta]
MSSKKCQDPPAADLPSDLEPVASPPSSPTISPSLLPRINEKEDDIACSSDSDVWSLGSDRDINAPELFAISSDSYFSQHRESFGELRGRALDTPISTKKGRRASDLSLRSNNDYGNYTESDNEHTKTPSRPGRRRSSTPQNKRSGSSRSRTRDGAPESGSGSEISQTAKIFKNLLILEESLRQQNRRVPSDDCAAAQVCGDHKQGPATAQHQTGEGARRDVRCSAGGAQVVLSGTDSCAEAADAVFVEGGASGLGRQVPQLACGARDQAGNLERRRHRREGGSESARFQHRHPRAVGTVQKRVLEQGDDAPPQNHGARAEGPIVVGPPNNFLFIVPR